MPVVEARLQRAAEAAKIALSDHPYVTICEEYLFEHQGVPIHLNLEIERHEYEAMIAHFIDETLSAVHTALSGAQLTVSDIDEILLVGGATRTPLIARRLEQELGLVPRSEVSLDLCVAMGAAIQAGIIGGEQTATVLVDVTPYTFGTSYLGERHGAYYPHCFMPLIRKNTPIPVTKSEVFYTMQDGQEGVMVTVYQGEDSDALNNIKIGDFKVEGLRDVPAGNPIVIEFTLNLDGMLNVTTREKVSGLAHSITINNAMAAFDDAALDAARARVQTLFADENEATEAGNDAETDSRRLRVEAQALQEKAQRLLSEAGTEDAEDLVNSIELIEDAKTQDDAALQQAMNELADLLYHLEA